MIFSQLLEYSDTALFLLRLIVAVIFIISGWSHIRFPEERGKSIGQSAVFTFALGLVEILSSIGLIVGVYIQVAALLLVGVMLGAIYKKVFVWKTGFWGKGSQGWHYDLLLLLANLVFMTTA